MSVAQGLYPGNKVDNYEEILAGALRNPAPRVRAPALVCNVAFWNPLKTSASTEQARYARNTDADRYLASLWKTLNGDDRRFASAGPPFTENRVDDKILLLSNFIDHDGTCLAYRYLPQSTTSLKRQTVTFDFDWYGVRATIRLEQYSEFIALTYVIDFSSSTDLPGGAVDTPIPELVARFAELNRKVSNKAFLSPAEYEACHDTFYQDIWNRFYDTVLEPSAELEAGLGEIFADFRGLILSPQERGADDANGDVFRFPFWLKRNGEDQASRGFGAKPEPIDYDWVINNFWNFIRAQFYNKSIEEFQVTASTMLDRAALFASALGAQPSVLRPETRTPIFYLLYVNTVNAWEIGRLIDRIHQAERSRLAALVEFEKLRSADYRLQEIDARLDQFQSYQEAYEKLTGLTDAAKERKLREIMRELRTFINQFEVDLRSVSEPFSSGIEYRIERSRFYTSEFNAAMQGLGLGPINGFEPYGDFVQRRLGQSFNFIEYLSNEYQRVVALKNSMHQYFSFIEQQRIELSAGKSSRSVARLLEISDIALWWVLTPYYFGAMFVEHIFHSGQEWDDLLVWLAVWNLSVMFWAVKAFRSLKSRTSLALYGLAIVFVLLVDAGYWRFGNDAAKQVVEVVLNFVKTGWARLSGAG